MIINNEIISLNNSAINRANITHQDEIETEHIWRNNVLMKQQTILLKEVTILNLSWRNKHKPR